MAIFFTSDLHLGHKNILGSRPQFHSIEEMDEYLIKKWNDKVGETDTVYLLGDLSYRASCDVRYYLSRLKGRKHLIIGNHDGDWMKKMDQDTLNLYFESVKHMDCIKYGKILLTLCHYPLLEWSGSRYPDSGTSYLLHGHIHDSTNLESYKYIKKNLSTALNCGVDINDYEPVTLEELMQNNKRWYGRRQ